MKFLDLVRLIINNLSRRKARVALTAIGVVIGTGAVVILVSLAIGLQMNATEQLYGIGDLSLINVMPAYGGEMFMAGGGGMGGGVVVESSGSQDIKLLTNSALEELRAIPGVLSVIPREYLQANMMITYRKLIGFTGAYGVGTNDLADFGLEAEQGVTQLSRNTVVIGPMVAQNFMDPNLRPGQELPPPPELFDQQIQFTVIKYDSNGAEIRKNYSLRVAGILKESGTEADFSMYLPLELVKSMNEWANNTRINYNKTGYNEVIVKVENADKTLEVRDQILALGFQANTLLDFVQGINNFYTILQVVLGGVGAIALLVAAIGIANTMAMSILERTREIGLMKAVGATNRDVLSIFLGEAAGIGFLGGLGGVLVGWLLGQMLNVVAVVYLAQQAAQQGGIPPSVAVYTPAWLPIFVLLFSTFIGMLSGLYPALRAATMIPVLALKYE
ncbi:MAG TPA: ABC transporter permease [Anaerolineales bacterium]|nr:ABC transporter permease [Anaerolineales bacterium]HNB35898.1 ABC transporter permease [Anaerolineales bacterium]